MISIYERNKKKSEFAIRARPVGVRPGRGAPNPKSLAENISKSICRINFIFSQNVYYYNLQVQVMFWVLILKTLIVRTDLLFWDITCPGMPPPTGRGGGSTFEKVNRTCRNYSWSLSENLEAKPQAVPFIFSAESGYPWFSRKVGQWRFCRYFI